MSITIERFLPGYKNRQLVVVDKINVLLERKYVKDIKDKIHLNAKNIILLLNFDKVKFKKKTSLS